MTTTIASFGETHFGGAMLGHQRRNQCLVLHDTTELDYSGLLSITDLGPIGGGLNRGYLCHNSLALDPERHEVIGLANQILHRRRHVGRKEGVKAKRQRADRESRLWTLGLAAVGPMSVVATTLLNLREASRRPDAKTRPATDLVDARYGKVISAWRYKKILELSIHDFFYAVARLGAHQNRKGDHRPGRLILWRGWMALQHMVDGAEAINLKRCG